MANQQSILITGVSSGIGRSIAAESLRRGAAVFGLSRRRPDDLSAQDRFTFQCADLRRTSDIPAAVGNLLHEAADLDLVVLNAGILGPFGDVIEQPLDAMQDVMTVNVWANKVILDALFARGEPIRQVVTISSGASVNGNRGWGGYSISKAALNMLTRLYARERPETHFCALAPGLVDTAMQDHLCALPQDERYPALDVLRSKRDTPDMPDAEELAPRLIEVFAKLPSLVESGDYADIRKPPLAD